MKPQKNAKVSLSNIRKKHVRIYKFQILSVVNQCINLDLCKN